MLRPSRPMIRPFMSSEGSSTSETVVSAAWLAATRWSASRPGCGRAGAPPTAPLLELTDPARKLVADELSERVNTSAFASFTVIPETRSSSSSSRSFAAFNSS